MVGRWTIAALSLSLWASVFPVPLSAMAEEPEPPKTFKVVFKSQPPGAMVEIDTQPKCKTLCSLRLEAGSYVIGMTMPGREWREELVEVAGNRTIKWKLPVTLGTLNLNTIPEGLNVRVTRNGKKKGKDYVTPVEGLKLDPGGYVAALRDDNYQPYKKMFTIEPGKPTELVLEPIGRMGELAVTVLDQYGDVDEGQVTLSGKRLQGKGPWPVKPGK